MKLKKKKSRLCGMKVIFLIYIITSNFHQILDKRIMQKVWDAGTPWCRHKREAPLAVDF